MWFRHETRSDNQIKDKQGNSSTHTATPPLCWIPALLLQIHSPDEFDMMLKLQAPSRLNMTELDGGLFYRIDFARPTRSPIQAFLLENERTLSSSKILSEMYRLVRKFLKTYQGVIIAFHHLSHLLFVSINRYFIKSSYLRPVCVYFTLFPVPDKCCRWEVNRKRPNSPAVTLSLFRTENCSDELISVDVVPALEVIV